MKILGVNGSARKDGNTAILINTVFDRLNQAGIETEMGPACGKQNRAMQSVLRLRRPEKLCPPE